MKNILNNAASEAGKKIACWLGIKLSSDSDAGSQNLLSRSDSQLAVTMDSVIFSGLLSLSLSLLFIQFVHLTHSQRVVALRFRNSSGREEQEEDVACC